MEQIIMFYTLFTNTSIHFMRLIINKWMNKDIYIYMVLEKIFSYLKSAPPILKLIPYAIFSYSSIII